MASDRKSRSPERSEGAAILHQISTRRAPAAQHTLHDVLTQQIGICHSKRQIVCMFDPGARRVTAENRYIYTKAGRA